MRDLKKASLIAGVLAASLAAPGGPSASVARAIPTTNSGQAYVDECAAAGVPTPPDWGDPEWVWNGPLDDPFISTELTAHVYFYLPNTSPAGVCIALPRVNDANGRVKLLGIICQGNETNRACFWDNSGPNKLQFDIASIDTFTPLSAFNGGAALEGAQGGACTNCHAGENVFNIQPGTALDLAAQGIDVKPNDFVQPIVPAAWSQNTLTNNVDGVCSTACHNQAAVGRFPRLTTEVSGFCDAEMATAWMKGTMPPNGIAQTPDYEAHYLRMLQICLDTAPQSPPPGLRQPTVRAGDAIAALWLMTDL